MVGISDQLGDDGPISISTADDFPATFALFIREYKVFSSLEGHFGSVFKVPVLGKPSFIVPLIVC